MNQYQMLPPLIMPLIGTYPYVSDCDLFINYASSSGTPGPAGPPGPQGLPGTLGLVPVSIVTTTPYVATITDYYIAVSVATAASIVLPISITGTVFIIKDIDGDSPNNPITITAAGGFLFDSAVSAIISSPFGALQVVFNGTDWNIV